MKKRNVSFRPTVDGKLEDRALLSGGVRFLNGAAILPMGTLVKAQQTLNSAYLNYAQHGQNMSRLLAGINQAASLIPFNVRDGLRATLVQDAFNMRASMAQGTDPTPVITAMRQSRADLNGFVASEQPGTIVVI